MKGNAAFSVLKLAGKMFAADHTHLHVKGQYGSLLYSDVFTLPSCMIINIITEQSSTVNVLFYQMLCTCMLLFKSYNTMQF